MVKTAKGVQQGWNRPLRHWTCADGSGQSVDALYHAEAAGGNG